MKTQRVRLNASQLKVTLAVLSIFVVTQFGLRVEDTRVPLDDVQVKGNKNTGSGGPTTDLFPASTTTNMSSAILQPMDIGQIQRKVAVVDDGNNADNEEDHDSLNNLLDNVPSTATTSSDIGGNTSSIIQEKPNSGATTQAPVCCLHPSMDMTASITPQFFKQKRSMSRDPRTQWTGKEYDEWVAIAARLYPNHTKITNLDCTTQYILLILEQASGFYLRSVLTELGNGTLTTFPYHEEKSGLPRILLLGDSISIGIRRQTQLHYHGLANIQGVPTNAQGFPEYTTALQQWLGDCPWDIVQFNVGMHYHPRHPDNHASWQNEYSQGITNIVNEIRKHSPKAHIVFALTTPSPFDSNATTPNKSTCPHYNKFHKAGFVPAMNDVVKSVAEKLDITINDRYSFILPVLQQYQGECDVHYSIEGYQQLAKQDWNVFSALLSINATTGSSNAGNTPTIVIHPDNNSMNETHGEDEKSTPIMINSDNNSRNETHGEAGNTPTIIINSDNHTSPTIGHETPACCFRPSVDLEKKLSPEFFHDQRTNGIDPNTKWSGKEYEEWVAIWARLNPNHVNYTTLDCPTQYKLLVLDQVSGLYLRKVMNELVRGKFDLLPYYNETPGLPRILLLGDSLSRGIRHHTQLLNHGRANIQGAPTNCYGFDRYSSGLKHWLGLCEWDIVQFNVGMHFHPAFPDNYTSWDDEYRQGITNIVNEIRAHSPSAHIVFALTTPSPFDSKVTTPNRTTCPHYDLFHKAGFVPAMNELVRSLSEQLGIIINDRYSAIYPVLHKYQKRCDVHFHENGYRHIANHDWKVFSEALSPKQ